VLLLEAAWPPPPLAQEDHLQAFCILSIGLWWSTGFVGIAPVLSMKGQPAFMLGEVIPWLDILWLDFGILSHQVI